MIFLAHSFADVVTQTRWPALLRVKTRISPVGSYVGFRRMQTKPSSRSGHNVPQGSRGLNVAVWVLLSPLDFSRGCARSP